MTERKGEALKGRNILTVGEAKPTDTQTNKKKSPERAELSEDTMIHGDMEKGEYGA
ncbi:MAG: hypothetical protein IPH20_26240 [Bacteroidales bacterium]|nr:hypothetical protein [Bacteroidales bacterium]